MELQRVLVNNKIQFVIIAVVLAICYGPIVLEMGHWWYRDDNYSHGFLVPFIAGYFFWQRWPEVREKIVTPNGLGLVVIVLGLLQLLVGYLATEYFTMRASLIVVLAGIVLFWFGADILRRVALPVGYLLLMVPIPYIVYDMVAFPLKLFVTKVSVGFLKVLGVLVVREGNIIMFPSTTLEVADACSGIRSLMSLIALAVAYAYFLDVSNVRRWLIIIAAVPIAVATNAMRVIVTGILAQWWGAAAAEGFFHEFAGLAVFALAIVLLVAVGGLVKRGSSQADNHRQAEEVSAPVEAIQTSSVTPVSRYRVVIVGVLLMAASLYLNLHTDISVPPNRPLREFPVQIQLWQMKHQALFSDDVLKVLKPTDYIYREYAAGDGPAVTLYLGYHSGGKESGEIHSPKHCLPGSGWHEVSTKQVALEVAGTPLHVVRAVYQKDTSSQLYLYWFQVKGTSLSDEYSLKLAEITNSLLHQRRDSAFIRISVPFTGDEGEAIATAERFVKDFYPAIKEVLPQ